jgi:hypothetical protein
LLGIPSLPRSINYQGSVFNAVTDNTELSFSAEDDSNLPPKIFVSIDGKEAFPYNKPLYFLSEGAHRVSYYAVDEVGNREMPKTLNIFTVSGGPKTLALIDGNSVTVAGILYARTDSRLKLEASSPPVGIERIEFQEAARAEASTNFVDYVKPYEFKTVGPHYIRYRSIDRAGNVETPRTLVVTVVKSEPVTQIKPKNPVSPHDGIFYSPSPNLFSLEAASGNLGITRTLFSINSLPFKEYREPIKLEGDNETFKITYKSIDALGVEEVPKTISYVLRGQKSLTQMFPIKGQSVEEKERSRYFQATPLLIGLPTH